MSKVIYYRLQLVGLRETVASGDILDTIDFNGYDTGVNRYYFVPGNTPSQQGYDADYLEYTITEATFTTQNTSQTVAVQTEIETLQFPVWVSKVVPDNFVIPTAPDLSVRLNSLTPTTLQPNGSITLAFDVKNNGTQTAGANNIGIYLSSDAIIDKSDTLMASFQQGAIAGKSTSEWYNVTSPPLSIPGGTHYIGIIADINGAVSEANEGNNVSNAIKITSKAPTPADLKVSLKSATPTSVASNGSLRIEHTLTNSGDTDAIAPATVFYLSKDATIDNNDLFLGSITVDMARNSTLSRAYDWGLYDVFPAGKYYLGAIIDRDGIIAESNEANNKSNAIPITITGQNLAPIAGDDIATTTYKKPIKIDILANDSDPNPGDKLTFVVEEDKYHKGSVKINSDKTITYTPDDDFVGIDTFTYTLSDGKGGQTTGTIAVGVDWEDPNINKGVLRPKTDPYDWDFSIPDGIIGTYTFNFEVTAPTTLHGIVDCGPNVFAELIANPGNTAPTLGLGPDRRSYSDDGYRNSANQQLIDDPLMPGKYSLVMTRELDTSGGFSQVAQPGWVNLTLTADEAGNRIEWAKPIRTGAPTKGAVDVIDNKDVYKFTLKEQSSVLVSLAVDGHAVGIDGVPPIHYEIMTNAGSTDYYHVLDSHIDAASRYVSSAYTAPVLDDVANNPLDPGDYYVIIYHPESIIAPPQDLQTFKYSLWVNSWVDNAANRPLTTDFGQEGPKSADIGDITSSTYKNRDFLGLADANDYYMFTLSERQTVSIALKQSSKTVSMDLELSNMAGGGSTDIIVDAVETAGGARSIIATLDAGAYFLRASTDTDFTDPNGTSKYGTPLVLPHKGGGYYDLTIKSAAPISAPGIILGTTGVDNFRGGASADRFNGKAGSDRIEGGDGDDFLAGDLGADSLTGGGGRDTFAYLKPTDGPDTIEDFVSGEDKIGIVKSAFGLTKVSLNASDEKYDFALHYFISGAGAIATEAHGQFLFDTSSHTLVWDANGTGKGGEKVLATLSNGATLSANDFDLL